METVGPVDRQCDAWSLRETIRLSHSSRFYQSMDASMDPMTQRSDSCGRVHGGSASEVPFPWLKRVRPNRECNSEVWLTLAVRRVHAKDQRLKTDLYTQCLCTSECSEVEVACCYCLFEMRNGAPFYNSMWSLHATCPAHALHTPRYEVPSELSDILHTISIHLGTFLVNVKVSKLLCLT